MTKVLLALVTFASGLFYAFCLGLLQGVVVADLWRWFVVSAMPVKALSTMHAWGMCLVVHVLHSRYVSKDDSQTTKEPTAMDSLWILVKPAIAVLMAWLIGWLIHGAMVSP